MTPYADSAHAYRDHGWDGVLPVGSGPGEKVPPPSGFTGAGGAWPSTDQINVWVETLGDRNVALRLPQTVVGLDVDDYDGKPGKTTMLNTVEVHQSPGRTWTSTSREGSSGIRFYRLPADAVISADRLADPDQPQSSGVEVIRHGHRYAVVAPSVHPEGRPYVWVDPDGKQTDKKPTPDQLTELPQAWVDHINQECSCFGYDWTQYVKAGGGAEGRVKGCYEEHSERMHSGSRHDGYRGGKLALTHFAESGWPKADHYLEKLDAEFQALIATDPDRKTDPGEVQRIADWIAKKTNSIPKYDPNYGTQDFETEVAKELTRLKVREEATRRHAEGEAGSWPDPVPITDFNLSDIQEPSLLYRDDQQPLLYAGLVNVLFGAPETAKSWIAAHAGLAEVRYALEVAPDRQAPIVVVLDWEDTGELWRQRLTQLGATTEEASYFQYVKPDAALRGSIPTAIQDADLVIIDSQNEASTAQGLNPMNSDDNLKFRQQLLEPLRVHLRAGSGKGAVLVIDHTPLSDDLGRRAQFGGQTKLSGVQGAQIKVRVIEQPAPGRKGAVGLFITKDRNGKVRAAGNPVKEHPGVDWLGTVQFNPYDTPGTTGGVRLTFLAPRGEVFGEGTQGYGTPDAVAEVLLDVVARMPGNSKNGIVTQASYEDDMPSLTTLRGHLDTLITQGFIRTEPGQRGALACYLGDRANHRQEDLERAAQEGPK